MTLQEGHTSPPEGLSSGAQRLKMTRGSAGEDRLGKGVGDDKKREKGRALWKVV